MNKKQKNQKGCAMSHHLDFCPNEKIEVLDFSHVHEHRKRIRPDPHHRFQSGPIAGEISKKEIKQTKLQLNEKHIADIKCLRPTKLNNTTRCSYKLRNEYFFSIALTQ